ncbi:MAG TPA: bifunctional alpha/beta hydrolase/class I SAM-dependent methyltransferase [Candidatus Angelobacter sp.]|nr:bifunctional alpha/beta hydrolase/class I SAM-dependent methyltransferase [Candidatus Angelobacter sp.]
MPQELLTSVSTDIDPELQQLRGSFGKSASRTAELRYFEATDRSRIFYRYWPALTGPSANAVILLHRGHEHSGRVEHLVDELGLPSFNMFAWDARGHGRSAVTAPGSGSFATLVRDLDDFFRHISATYGIPAENIAIVGQSVSAALAAAWVHDYAPKIRCLVLAAPAFRIKLYFPFAYRLLGLLHRLRGDFNINSYVKPRVLTHDPERVASYKADPLITRPVSVQLLLQLERAGARIAADAQAITVPTQVLVSGRDFVVRTQPQLDFFKHLGASVKEQHWFQDFYHDVLGEKDRALALQKVRRFIVSAFSLPCSRTELINSDKNGASKQEFDQLSRPLPLFSLKRIRFAVAKLGLRVGSLFSPGIRLGFKTGFDSGSSLDYVYRNQPSGATPIRRLIDRRYLDSIGWKGIRQRKENLVRALLDCVARLRRHGLPVRIVDIAAGRGRYVLEALEKCGLQIDSVRLRDLSETNVQAGRELIEQKSMSGIVRFETGNAFDRAALAGLQPRPTLAVVSGLYELFPENQPVRDSLAGLAEAVAPGGLLIYTGQPFHPQLEMIARTLPSHRDFRPWVMRRRSQAEIDQLVEAAGFGKLEQQIDEWGIFTVSIAERL